jgi:hypothetical protein
MTKLTGKQYSILHSAIVCYDCKVNRYDDNRSLNAMVKAGYIVSIDNSDHTTDQGFSYDVTPIGYRAALVYAATGYTGAFELGIEELVKGYANHKREYTKD